MKINKDLIYLTVIAGLIAVCAQFFYSFKVQPAWQAKQASKVDVVYNKDVPANELVIDGIRQANEFVYFGIYTFTRTDIKDALLAAKYRGLDVKGVIDQEQTQKIDDQKNIVKELISAGIPIVFDDHSAIMHLKVLVTDKSYISGSYNWTVSATTSNDEVLEIGHEESIRQQYKKLIEKLFNKYPPATL